MQQSEIKRILDVGGKKVTATKKLPVYQNGIVFRYDTIDVILEIDYSGFGLEIVQFEESDYYAIWFNGELVFDNIKDRFNPLLYGRQSNLMGRLVDSHTGLSKKADTYIPGEWETVLTSLSKNIKRIADKRKLIDAETEKNRKWLKNFHEAINLYIPFRYGHADPGFEPKKSWHDDVVHIVGKGEDMLKIYIYTGEKKFLKKQDEVLVYDYTSSFLKKGTWQKHLEGIIEAKRKKKVKKASKFGYSAKRSSITEKKRKTVQEEQQKTSKTAKEWLSEIKAYTT